MSLKERPFCGSCFVQQSLLALDTKAARPAQLYEVPRGVVVAIQGPADGKPLLVEVLMFSGMTDELGAYQIFGAPDKNIDDTRRGLEEGWAVRLREADAWKPGKAKVLQLETTVNDLVQWAFRVSMKHNVTSEKSPVSAWRELLVSVLTEPDVADTNASGGGGNVDDVEPLSGTAVAVLATLAAIGVGVYMRFWRRS